MASGSQGRVVEHCNRKFVREAEKPVNWMEWVEEEGLDLEEEAEPQQGPAAEEDLTKSVCATLGACLVQHRSLEIEKNSWR
ncbi:unnamed protein product [Coccothraustes coccothraustes]